MKRNLVLRAQGTYERLAHYISEVRESALLLQVKWSEQQLVDTILVGLSPEERSRLALVKRPTTFTELELCCIHSSDVWYSDQNRSVSMSQSQSRNSFQTRPIGNDTRNYRDKRFVSTYKTHNYPHVSYSKTKPRQPTSEVSEERRCYNCGKAGHISKLCKLKRYLQKTDQSKNV